MELCGAQGWELHSQRGPGHLGKETKSWGGGLEALATGQEGLLG